MVSFGNEETIAEANKRFSAHVEGTALIPADLRSAVYRAVLSNADDSVFETVLKVCSPFIHVEITQRNAW